MERIKLLPLLILCLQTAEGLIWNTIAISNVSCAGNNISLVWSYTLESGEIFSLTEWTKSDGAGGFINVADDFGGFTPAAGYSGRLKRIGNAGIQISNATFADGGTYYVSVALASGQKHIVNETVEMRMAPLPPPSGCSVTASQSGNTVTCTVNGNCGIPALNAYWTTSNQFECTVGGTYQCCATSAALTCYSGSPNDFCTLFNCTPVTTTKPKPICALESFIGLALGVGLGSDTICIISLIFIMIMVKTVNIQDKDELQKPLLEGSVLTITAYVHGFCISSVQWIGPHGNILTSNGKYKIKYSRKTGKSTLQISALEINDSGLYMCRAKGVCGSSAQDSVRITAYEKLAVDIDIGETCRQHGSDVKFICSVYGSENKSVRWIGPKENVLTDGGRYKIVHDSDSSKSSLTITTSSMTNVECYICEVVFKEVSVKIYITITVLDNGSLRVRIEKIILFVPGSENVSREWIGPQGTLTNTENHTIVPYDSTTKKSQLTINSFSANDNGSFTCQHKKSSESSQKYSITVTTNDTTNRKKDANKLILGLGFGIICLDCIACIVILVTIGESCALKFAIGLGLGLGIPFVGCIIVIVILFKKVFKPPQAHENRKIKSGKSVPL